MKRYIITGGTGFLGRAITAALQQRGDSVVTITRGRGNGADLRGWDELPTLVEGAQAVINLAGSSVGGPRWSARVRHEILTSRTESTRKVVDAIAAASTPPALISASAVGYYGNTMIPSNEALPAGQTFLAEVTAAWEREAERARAYTRVCTMRIGMVLDPREGALPKMALPMKLGIGGPLGSGRQHLPWVHRDDVVSAFLWAADDSNAFGPYNVVAPQTVTMREFASVLGRVLHRPSWLPVPSPALRLLLGKQADVVLHGQYVIPSRLLGTPFRFAHPELNEALTDLLG
jgi:uncharacterized protein (TIGR01777 family)